MHVLVTGGNGYVGKYVLAELVRRRIQVTTLAHEDRPVPGEIKHAGRVVVGDILQKESIRFALDGVDAVIHLAAAVRISDAKRNFDVNLQGTRNLIDVCQEARVGRVIFTSSVSVLKRKRGPYGESKLQAEKLFEQSSLDYTIFRPEMIYGLEGKGINNVIRYTLGFPFVIPLIGNGRWIRQPVSVNDVARVLVESIENRRTFRKIYPLAGGDKVQFRELVDMIALAAGVRKVKICLPVWLCYWSAVVMERLLRNPPFTSENVRSLSQNTEMDISEMVQDTGFQPTSLSAGINRLVGEMKENGLI